MILLAETLSNPAESELLQGMFEGRKKIFVDLLKWDVPVIAGRFEVDQFDDQHARYLVAASEEGDHLGSARLLPTTRPHILGTLFPELCAGPLPVGQETKEITRFCLARTGNGMDRRIVRNRLVSALVRDALASGTTTYTGVAEMGWLQQILAFGWRCRPLGLPHPSANGMIGALAIEIDIETPVLLAQNGIWVDEPSQSRLLEAA